MKKKQSNAKLTRLKRCTYFGQLHVPLFWNHMVQYSHEPNYDKRAKAGFIRAVWSHLRQKTSSFILYFILNRNTKARSRILRLIFFTLKVHEIHKLHWIFSINEFIYFFVDYCCTFCVHRDVHHRLRSASLACR